MQKYLTEAHQLLALAIPVILAQAAQTGMGFVDATMVGSYSAVDMAAVTVGTSIWLPIILFGHGLLLALTPVIAQLNGAGQRHQIGHQVHQGYWLAGMISIVVMALLFTIGVMISRVHNIDTTLAEKVGRFLHALLWGAPGYLFFQVNRCQCEGLSKTKPGMVVGFLGLLVVIPVNYLFIYGKLGMPELGGVGCGIATALAYWVMFFALQAFCRHAVFLNDIRHAKASANPDLATLRLLAALGLPVALALFFEITLFAIISLLLIPLGIVNVDGHQIALNFSSLMFVLPFSISTAATIRVGYRLGQGSVADAAVAAWAAQGVGVIIACCTALFTILFRKEIALLYNDNPAIVALAASLMLLAALFQLSDAIQVIGNGILRGYKDTHAIFYITLTSYWILGFPCGYILALTDWVVAPMGPAGFWTGFIVGLTTCAALMILRIRHIQHRSPEHILRRTSR